ncbi:MAG: hypothetical protein JTT11_07850 [Candidatus Brockarchaeota archaeon]|nr:hypothetical protein [Candidatus Brockarchaeota archaeon]
MKSRKGEVLFSPSPGGKFKKARLSVNESIEIETSVAFGLVRATYRAELRDVVDFSMKEGAIELHLRAAGGPDQSWLVKTPQAEDWMNVLRNLGVKERPVAEQPAPGHGTALHGGTAPAVATSFAVKLALHPGKWMTAKINLTSESLQVEAVELFGMMPRPVRVAVEMKALKSFSRSDKELIKLKIESKPGYGLGEEWAIATKQRDELARALLSFGVEEILQPD